MTYGSHLARPIVVEAAVHCDKCGTTVPLAGPVLSARCHACGNNMTISPLLWIQTLGEADELSFDSGATRTAAGACRRDHGGVHLRIEWSASAPSCRRCGGVIGLVEPGSAGETKCESCQASMPTFPAPPWLRRELSTALQVYGVEYVFDAAALEAGARRWWLVFQGTPARKAIAHDRLIFDETIALSKRTPIKKDSNAYMIPLLLCLAVIALALYMVGGSVARYEDDPVLGE